MRRVDYIYFHSDSLPGVTQKIKHTVSALRDLGCDARAVPVVGSFLSKRLELLRRIFFVRADIVVLRYEFLTPFIYVPFLLVHRMLGRKIIIDVPTPLSVGASEVRYSKEQGVAKFLKLMALYLQGPFPLWVANLVLQYAPESKYFSLGLGGKILYISNGLDTLAYHGFCSAPQDSSNVNFICVGSVANWHGIDRFIEGVALYNRSVFKTSNVSLAVVGEGEEISFLVKLVETLGLQRQVTFLGRLTGDALLDVYRNADVGVGTLGLHRKGLNIASPLKTREYCALGLPFLMSHEDPDFVGAQVCLWVEASDFPIDIVEVLRWFSSVKNTICAPDQIKAFARAHLDYRSKWERILEVLF